MGEVIDFLKTNNGIVAVWTFAVLAGVFIAVMIPSEWSR